MIIEFIRFGRILEMQLMAYLPAFAYRDIQNTPWPRFEQDIFSNTYPKL
jgi:hypothetical protein